MDHTKTGNGLDWSVDWSLPIPILLYISKKQPVVNMIKFNFHSILPRLPVPLRAKVRVFTVAYIKLLYSDLSSLLLSPITLATLWFCSAPANYLAFYSWTHTTQACPRVFALASLSAWYLFPHMFPWSSCMLWDFDLTSFSPRVYPDHSVSILTTYCVLPVFS